MTTSNFNLRGLPIAVMNRLKLAAQKQDTSVNLLIIRFIEQGIGYSHEVRKNTHHELDKLAGTWSEEEAAEFQRNTADFEKIDKDLWT